MNTCERLRVEYRDGDGGGDADEEDSEENDDEDDADDDDGCERFALVLCAFGTFGGS